MTEEMRKHYLEYGPFTYPGLYEEYFRSLPDDPSELGHLISHQIIHRVTLREGNKNANFDLRYGDMDRWPWYRSECQDDIYLTAPAIAAGLFRLDGRGFVPDRAVEHKLVLTCRFVSVLVTSIYKAKGVPCRSRAGFAPYIGENSMDHWINQVWLPQEGRWLTFDAAGFYEGFPMPVTQYDMEPGQFDWSAKAWLDIRSGKTDGARFLYADGLGTNGLRSVGRYLVYDFHALMNHEISYVFQPRFMEPLLFRGESLPEEDMALLDRLAELLMEPDKNFDKLLNIWNTERKLRDLTSPLVG